MQLESQKAARESQRQLDEQKSASRIAELQSALDAKTVEYVALQQSMELARTEQARLQKTASQTTRQLESAQADAKREMDEKVREMSRKLDAFQTEEHKVRHTRHVATCTLNVKEHETVQLIGYDIHAV